MVRKIPSFAALCVLALSGSAIAEDRGVPGIDVDVSTNFSMPMADKNSDGKVTKAEAASNSRLAAQFDRLDRNRDGSLDKGEFAKFESTAETKADIKSMLPGNKDGAPGDDEGTGDERANVNKPGTIDDSTPGNKDLLGPGR